MHEGEPVEHRGDGNSGAALRVYKPLRSVRTARVRDAADWHGWMRQGSDRKRLFGHDAFEFRPDAGSGAFAPLHQQEGRDK
jgi:hypothetical protein